MRHIWPMAVFRHEPSLPTTQTFYDYTRRKQSTPGSSIAHLRPILLGRWSGCSSSSGNCWSPESCGDTSNSSDLRMEKRRRIGAVVPDARGAAQSGARRRASQVLPLPQSLHGSGTPRSGRRRLQPAVEQVVVKRFALSEQDRIDNGPSSRRTKRTGIRLNLPPTSTTARSPKIDSDLRAVNVEGELMLAPRPRSTSSRAG
jgi:hypothetical protein